MEIKLKKLHENAVIPQYAKLGDAGLDLTATTIEYTKDYIAYKTGLAFAIPEGYFGILVPRSSNSKKDLLLINSCGILDSGFRGEVEFRYKCINNYYSGKSDLTHYEIYQVGDRIGQLIILPYPQIEFQEVKELNETERGKNGFGSSGK
jgi:dUTP pyrophosphatase